MTVSYFDRSTLAVLAPTVREQLDISGTAYGWLTSAFSIAYLVATPLTGWWIDRVGARRGLVISVLAWTTVAALHALVPGFWVLFALRIALGITEGPSFPGAAQTIQRILPAAERSRGFGVLFTGSSIGGMLAPPIASALFAAYGWRSAFLTSALIGLVWLPVWLFWTRQRGVPEQLDRADASEAVVRTPVLEVLRHPAFLRGFIAILAVAPVFGFALSWGAVYLSSRFGIAQARVGDYLWLPPVVFDAAVVLFGHIASKQHRPDGAPPRLLFSIGMVLAVGLVALPWMPDAWNAIYVLGIAMAGGGIVYTLTTSDMLRHMPPGAVSLAAGALAAAQSLALVIANPLIGAAFDRYQSFDVPAIVLGLWVVPGCLVWLAWRVPLAQRAEPPPLPEARTTARP